MLKGEKPIWLYPIP